MNKYIYIVNEVPTALYVGGNRVVEVMSKCVVCNKPISNYTGYYRVTQQLDDWTDCPCKETCSELCANMLILSAVGEPRWRRLRGNWTIKDYRDSR